MSARLRMGCCSWTSDAWWGRVYPEGLKDGDRLAWYARLYDAVEVDSTYYRDPGAALFRRWARVTPDDFVFALKVPRDLLDPTRGVDPQGLADFVGHAQELGAKLGPLLLQFTPGFAPARGEAFLGRLAAALPPGPRYAVELRDPRWFQGRTFDDLRRTLRQSRLALTWSYLTYVEVPPELTTDFVYLRFIGDHERIAADQHGVVRVDRSAETRRWSAHLDRPWQEMNGRELYIFFNNHYAGFAPESLNEFRAVRGLPPVAYRPMTPRTGTLESYGRPSPGTRP